MGKIIRNGVVFGGGGSDDYTGTSAEVTEAIANGEIKNGMTVNITDDDDTETTLYNDIKEYIDNQINDDFHVGIYPITKIGCLCIFSVYYSVSDITKLVLPEKVRPSYTQWCSSLQAYTVAQGMLNKNVTCAITPQGKIEFLNSGIEGVIGTITWCVV